MQAKYLKSPGDCNIDWQNWDSGWTQFMRDIKSLHDPTGL